MVVSVNWDFLFDGNFKIGFILVVSINWYVKKIGGIYRRICDYYFIIIKVFCF